MKILKEVVAEDAVRLESVCGAVLKQNKCGKNAVGNVLNCWKESTRQRYEESEEIHGSSNSTVRSN
jgi:hypothetical protein